jgi:PKD repeat protein
MDHWRKDTRSFLLVISLLLIAGIFLSGCNKNDITGGTSKPTVTGMSPSRVVAGQQNVKGHITGTNFAGIVAVDLGDGIDIKNTNRVSDTAIDVTFTVHSDAAAGSRTIKVATVDGIASNASILSVSDNKPPVAKFSVNPSEGGLDTQFQFDASQSSDSDGSIKSYSWDFGDGASATGMSVVHKYGSASTFTATLSVTDNHDSTSISTQDIKVENVRPPVPHFTVSPPHGDPNTNFTFDGSNSTDDGRVVKWEWIFGDGTGTNGRIVHHRFPDVKTYSVQLTVTDNDNVTATTSKDVDIKGRAPLAAFSINPSSGDVSTTFTFDASASNDSDGSIVNYVWDFGDGSGASGKVVQHKYASNGTRNVQLTVTDNDGQNRTALHALQVDVVPPPPPPGGQLCTVPVSRQGTGLYGTVIAVNPGTSTVTIKLQYTDHHGISYETYTCANSFFKCGDLDPQGEVTYYGEVCSMTYFGNNTFTVTTKGAKAWPTPGQQNVFLKWQTCSIHSQCP